MKTKRQNKILELVHKYDIETQDDLIEKLRQEGISATQATISRDIRDLKLTKVATVGGTYKYMQPQVSSGINMAKLSVPIFASVKNADYSQNIIVIKTIPSMAPAIASGIDGMEMREVLGCVAGDDCVIVITRTEEDAAVICNKIRELIKLS